MINQDYNKKYELEKTRIGFGIYTEVYKAKNKVTKELRAIKIIKLDAIKYELEKEGETTQGLKDYIDNINNEIENMKICAENNENSVKYYESFQTKNEIAIVLELCDDCLSKFKNKKSFNAKKIREILKQLNNTLKIIMKIGLLLRMECKIKMVYWVII